MVRWIGSNIPKNVTTKILDCRIYPMNPLITTSGMPMRLETASYNSIAILYPRSASK